MEDYELKGRVVTQYFFDELEKIAVRAPAKVIQRTLNIANEPAEVLKTVGWKGYIPWTESGKAYKASQARVATERSRALDIIEKREAQARKTLASADDDASRREALRYLQEATKAKQRLSGAAPATRREQVRNVFRPAPKPAPEPEPQSVIQNPMVRRAALYAGLPTAGAAGLYGAQKYRQYQQQSEYGGY